MLKSIPSRPDMEIIITDDWEALEAMLERIEIAVRRFPRDLTARASNLRWHQQWGAGADWLLCYSAPHHSGMLPRNAQRVPAIFMDNLRRYQAGLPLHLVVDKAQAY